MAWSHAHGAPVHAHLSEQPLENAECRAAFGSTPAEVLYDGGSARAAHRRWCTPRT